MWRRARSLGELFHLLITLRWRLPPLLLLLLLLSQHITPAGYERFENWCQAHD